MTEANWADKTIFTGDNLFVMRGMNSATVDVIYLDPPFNSNANYAAPIGSAAAGAAFKDTWTLSDIDAEWINLMEDRHPTVWRVLMAAMTPSDKSYLAYMAVRLLEMRRVLKPTGSLFLHCDPTMSHYLKLLLDAAFGRGQFRNEIIWAYRGRELHLSRKFNAKHDVLLFYARSDAARIEMAHVAQPWSREDRLAQLRRKVHVDDDGREWVWETRGQSKGQKPYRRYVDDLIAQGRPLNDVWADVQFLRGNHPERTGYPTQKPLALLERIIAASTNRGDVVFDPFCGCATTLVAANDSGRSWIGVDISPKAAELVVHRIRDRGGLFGQIIHRTDTPQRTDLGALSPPRSAENRHRLYGQQDGRCAGCRERFPIRALEVDHIIARSKGGTDHPDNLQLLCGHCNRVKGDRGMDYLRAKLQLAA